ncbi:MULTISPECIES: HPP family protein [Halobacterium]|uniref:HPP family protein n=1 Tax=Halobacterium TaxID=2239 RepID=UPI001966BD11|nr:MULTISPECIES: HPP family protein [Halobacterium]MCF2164714.1 HPP family protein [Halobacterium salinarum]MCF2167607.1 HPP family protein [Halobacterium salinarum]MCF2239756.1 HPP family protein [Halobacterium salinarum]QRY22114.1 HPP family protein [Halobacterium sp. GSL-19]WJK63495.1 HPP family protein [Halobacterium salinarum]
MLPEVRRRLAAARRRVARIERRELRQLRRWLETTSNLLHASVLLFVPLLVGLVTLLSNTIGAVSFLLFPPLASGTYTLFSDPDGQYADPVTFVAGMTVGALCGWGAVTVVATAVYDVAPSAVGVDAGAAALAVLATGGATWLLGLELPTAFSTALLALFTGNAGVAYVAGVALSSSLVAVVFVVWRRQVYEERARYLYHTTAADDHVVVPMRGPRASKAAMLGARLAAAHDAGKVVLLDIVDDADVAAARRNCIRTAPDDDARVENAASPAEQDAAETAAQRLETQASRVETAVGVQCEVVVAVADNDPAKTVLATADEANCDLVVTPLAAGDDAGDFDGGLSPFVTTLFGSSVDVVALQAGDDTTNWKRIMVPVRSASDVAHAMLDYAARLAGHDGTVSACSCVESERDRRRAESSLASLTDVVDTSCETRVSRSSVESFIERNDSHYDLVLLGASTDRSAASKFFSRPTYERVADLDTDVALVHMG